MTVSTWMSLNALLMRYLLPLFSFIEAQWSFFFRKKKEKWKVRFCESTCPPVAGACAPRYAAGHSPSAPHSPHTHALQSFILFYFLKNRIIVLHGACSLWRSKASTKSSLLLHTHTPAQFQAYIQPCSSVPDWFALGPLKIRQFSAHCQPLGTVTSSLPLCVHRGLASSLEV